MCVCVYVCVCACVRVFGMPSYNPRRMPQTQTIHTEPMQAFIDSLMLTNQGQEFYFGVFDEHGEPIGTYACMCLCVCVPGGCALSYVCVCLLIHCI
jgi:hypothetical protein